MKGLHSFLENKIKPSFTGDGKLAKFFPVYDALETFAFVPGHTTHSGSHIRDGIDMKRTMFFVIVALIPCLIFGIYNTGLQSAAALNAEALAASGMTKDPSFWSAFMYGVPLVLPLVIVSYGAGLLVEFIFAIIKKHQINEGFLVSGMLIPLIMPIDVPLWMVALGTIFAVVIAKEVFGGTGMNILNVALTARAFLFFAYPTQMSGDFVWVHTGGQAVDGFSGATPLANAVTASPDTIMTQIPSVFESFMGTIPGSVGSTSVLMILIGAAFLLYTGIASWRVIFSAIIGGAVMGLIFNGLSGLETFADNAYLKIPWYHQMMLGGFAFGVVFMATDPVTAAQTNRGKWFYGFFIGFLAILVRTANPAYPEGIMLAILFMNVMAPLIDHYVIQSNVKKREKRAKLALA